ncbi:hypothetical protein [Vibrio harveyi]|uniref:hypothetical protein n=1 Tax=Vibrio harveyi TaxID=669 RepID=UPI003CF75B79
MIKKLAISLSVLLFTVSSSNAFAISWFDSDSYDLPTATSVVLDDLSSGNIGDRPEAIPNSLSEIQSNGELVIERYRDVIEESQYQLWREYDLMKADLQQEGVTLTLVGLNVDKKLPMNVLMTAWLEVVTLKVKASNGVGHKTFELRTLWYRHGERYTLTRLDFEV